MAQPTSGDVYVNVPLTNLSVAFMQSAANFVATQVFPTVPVNFQSGMYFTYPRDYWLRDEAKPRAPGTQAARSGYEIGSATYDCTPYAFAHAIDDQTLANAMAPISPEVEAMQLVTQKLLLSREAQFAASSLVSGAWTTTLAGVTAGPTGSQFLKWSDSGSTPVEDITTQIQNIALGTGMAPNTLLLTLDTFNALRNHPEIIDRYKYTQAGIMTEQLLAGVFGVEKVLVGRAIKAANVETAPATDVGSGSGIGTPILGSGLALLTYAAPSPGIRTASGGYTFTWTSYTGAGTEGNRIKSYRQEEIESTVIEGSLAVDPAVISPDLGCLFQAAI